MNRTFVRLAAIAIAALVVAGCEESKTPPTATGQPVTGPPTLPEPPPLPDALKDDLERSKQQQQANTERVKAEAGVGKKGQGLSDDKLSRVFNEPARAYFGVQQRIVFEIQLPKFMQLYKATHGNAPKSHEEFMKKIVEDNRLELPELPHGHRYIYDPQEEELMVERPKS